MPPFAYCTRWSANGWLATAGGCCNLVGFEYAVSARKALLTDLATNDE